MVEVSSEDGEEEEAGEKEDLVNLPFYNFTLLGQMVFALIIFSTSTVITTHQQFSRAMEYIYHHLMRMSTSPW